MNTRNRSLDLVKLILSFAVLIYHYNYYVLNWSSFWFRGGYIAVDFFFVFSGFYLVKQIQNEKNLLNFLRRRFRTLYPMYYTALIISFFANIPTILSAKTVKDIAELILRFLEELFLVQDWGIITLRHSFNNVTWYISVLIFTSLLFFSIKKFTHKEKAFYAVIASCTLLSILFMACLYGHLHQHGFIFGHISVGIIRAIAGMGVGVLTNLIMKYMVPQSKASSRKDVYNFFEEMLKRNTANTVFIILLALGIALTFICKDNYLDFTSYPLAVGILIFSSFSSYKYYLEKYYSVFSYAVYLLHISVLKVMLHFSPAPRVDVFIILTSVAAIALTISEKAIRNKLFSWI